MLNHSLDQLIGQKKRSKKMLAEELKFSAKKPLLGVFLDKTLSKEELLSMKEVLKGLRYINVNVVVLGDSDLKLNLDKVTMLNYSRLNRKKLLEASDMALAFSFSDVEEMLIHGIIPVSKKRKEILDYDPNHESGNAFIYKSDNPWEMFAALVRATETFRFPYDWKHIVREGMHSISKN